MSTEYTCPYCDRFVGGSHYHCPRCGRECSMMGHWREADKTYTCEPEDNEVTQRMKARPSPFERGASEAAPSPDPRLCVCGRLIVSMAGTLDYCAGCGQATCSCVIRPPAAPSLLQERDRLDVDRLTEALHRLHSLEFWAWWEPQPDGGALVRRGPSPEFAAAIVAALAATPTAEEPTDDQ